jgi:hypothetical protein
MLRPCASMTNAPSFLRLHRSAMSSSTSRRLSEKRRYQRTQVTIISAANCRFWNRTPLQDLVGSTYQIPGAEVATLPTGPAAADTSSLSLNLSVASFSMPRRFVTSCYAGAGDANN